MADQTIEITHSLLERLFGDEINGANVRLWDGSYWPTQGPAQATLMLKHPGALRAMFLSGTELALAEAYLFDDFDVDGDIEAALDMTSGLPDRISTLGIRLELARYLLRLPKDPIRRPVDQGPPSLRGRRHSIERDRQAISHHYDISNDFYRLFLDRRMVYSCAYFETPEYDLDTAQERKLDHICRKLRLQPGQRLLDIGCGWGGLVIHAAQRYGVDATGITLSSRQAELASERIREAGLADRARVRVQDYREVDESHPFDALVSVGMFEHVGSELLPIYFAKAMSLVRPRGVFLNHGIARGGRATTPRGRSFSDTYVFPDGELVPIHTTLEAAEGAGWEVRDVESLREHYMLTLRHWVRRLEDHHEEALRYVQEPTYRVWRLFMAGSAQGFRTERHNLYQTLLVRPDERGGSGLPLTRADWYCEALPAS
jgi:cyclopropane-fatty-acyl-phospholipid synthase